MPELTGAERAMLALEHQWFQYAGNKEQRIREEFDLSSTTYYLRLNRLIDNPAAMAHDPITVKRLQSLRDKRRGSRHA